MSSSLAVSRRARRLLLAAAALVPLACGSDEQRSQPPASGGSSGQGGAGGSAAGQAGASSGGSAGSAAGRGGSAAAGTAGRPGGGSTGEGGLGGDGSAGEGGLAGAGGDAGVAGEAGGAGAGAGGDAGAAGEGDGAGSGGTAGAGGSSGAGGSTGGAAGGGAGGFAGGIECNDDTERSIAGTIDGEDVAHAVIGSAAYSSSSPQFWERRGRLDDDGFVYFWGDELLAGFGDSASGRGHLVMPSTSPLAGTHYCAASVTMTIVSTFAHAGQIGPLTELGRCPDEPGDDQLSGCFGNATGAAIACGASEVRLIGTLGALDVDESFARNAHNTVGTGPTATRFMTFGRGGMIALLNGASGASGILRMPENGPAPGAVYCIGSATLTADGSDYGFVLDELGLVGVCPGASGASGVVVGCF